jgi:hypothetical protein
MAMAMAIRQRKPKPFHPKPRWKKTRNWKNVDFEKNSNRRPKKNTNTTSANSMIPEMRRIPKRTRWILILIVMRMWRIMAKEMRVAKMTIAKRRKTHRRLSRRNDRGAADAIETAIVIEIVIEIVIVIEIAAMIHVVVDHHQDRDTIMVPVRVMDTAMVLRT